MSDANSTKPIPLDEAIAIPIRDAARRLGISKSFLYLELERGNLVSAQIGKRRVIPVANLNAYLAAHTTPNFKASRKLIAPNNKANRAA